MICKNYVQLKIQCLQSFTGTWPCPFAFMLKSPNDYGRGGMACKTENIYYQVLYRKSLPTPTLHSERFFSVSPAKSSSTF